MPGCTASRMRCTATSATSIESCRHWSSSGVLIMRASSSGSWASKSEIPASRRCLGVPRLTSIEGESLLGPAVFPHQLDDAPRPQLDLLGQARAGQEVEGRRADALLVDGGEAVADVARGAELEQHDRPVDRDEDVAPGRVHRPHLHVARAGGVPDVHRIAQQGGAVAQTDELGPHLGQPVGVHLALVHLRQPRRDVDGEVRARWRRRPPATSDDRGRRFGCGSWAELRTRLASPRLARRSGGFEDECT